MGVNLYVVAGLLVLFFQSAVYAGLTRLLVKRGPDFAALEGSSEAMAHGNGRRHSQRSLALRPNAMSTEDTVLERPTQWPRVAISHSHARKLLRQLQQLDNDVAQTGRLVRSALGEDPEAE